MQLVTPVFPDPVLLVLHTVKCSLGYISIPYLNDGSGLCCSLELTLVQLLEIPSQLRQMPWAVTNRLLSTQHSVQDTSTFTARTVDFPYRELLS